jgi:hypothetical protein
MTTEGIVYVLTNPAMPGMVKIGKTSRGMDARLNELYSTGVPLPFECNYAARVADEGMVERAFHQAFGPYRINPKREFFSIEPEQAIALLRLMEIEDVTPSIQREADSVDTDAKSSAERLKKSRRPVMNYLDMGLPAGATLVFQDGMTTCTVVDGRHVNYNGEQRFLSAITAELMGIPGQAIHGGRYWSYEGHNLRDLYEETHGSDDIG